MCFGGKKQPAGILFDHRAVFTPTPEWLMRIFRNVRHHNHFQWLSALFSAALCAVLCLLALPQTERPLWALLFSE